MGATEHEWAREASALHRRLDQRPALAGLATAAECASIPGRYLVHLALERASIPESPDWPDELARVRDYEPDRAPALPPAARAPKLIPIQHAPPLPPRPRRGPRPLTVREILILFLFGLTALVCWTAVVLLVGDAERAVSAVLR